MGKSSRRQARRWMVYVLAVGIGLLGALPLWSSGGFLNTRIVGESPYLLLRVHQMAAILGDGVFPARWMPDAAYGLGYPFFHYYASLPFYLAGALRLLGYETVVSLKIVHTLGFIVAAVGMVGWLRPHVRSSAGVLLAAAAFTFAPLHMVNVYVRGDSMSEFWAMGMFPLVLWGVDCAQRRPRGALGLAAAFAALVLSHNASALLFAPLAGLYALIPRSRTTAAFTRGTLRVGTGFALGLALSAWFWLPVFVERDAVQIDRMMTGFFDWRVNFIDGRLFQPTLLYDYGAHPPQIGAWSAGLSILGAAGLAARALRGKRGGTAAGVWAAGAFIVGIAMTQSLSAPLYEQVPLLGMIQFPWRWLSVIGLAAAAVSGYAPALWARAPVPARRALTWAAVAGTALCALAALPLRFIPLSEADITVTRLNEAEYYSGDIGGGAAGGGAEYLPRAVTLRPFSGPNLLNLRPLLALSGTASGQMTARRSTTQVWQVRVDGPHAVVTVPLLYWDGWTARIDGGTLVPTQAAQGMGWIQVTLPQGEHTLTLELRDTPARALANGISLSAALLTVALMVLPGKRRRPSRAVLIVAAGGVVLLAALRLLPPALTVDAPSAAQYTTASYRHAFPGGIPFGDTLLLDYSYPDTITAGEMLDLRLSWSAAGVQARAELVVPRWGYDAALAVGIGHAAIGLRVPADAASGLYFVRLSANNVTYDLMPLRVAAGVPAPAAQTPLGSIADTLTLRRVRFSALDGGRLTVLMTWDLLRPAAAPYLLALRLRDENGRVLAAHDAPMGVYGTFPPPYWGTAFTDWITLSGLDGLPPGDDYQLVLTVYTPDAVMGSIRLQRVSIADVPPPADAVNATHITAGLATQGGVEQGADAAVDVRWTWQHAADSTPLRWTLVASDGTTYDVSTMTLAGCAWDRGCDYQTQARVTVPRDLPPGRYILRWAAAARQGEAGALDVLPTTRLFAAADAPARATFGGIGLLNYTLAQDGNSVRVTLGWRAVDTHGWDYTRFVHALDADGRLVAQSDVTFTAGGWIAGEVLRDEVTLTLPPGSYRIAIGWYDPLTLVRLSGSSSDDRFLLPDNVTIPSG